MLPQGGDAAAVKAAAAKARTDMTRQMLALKAEQERARADLDAARRAMEVEFNRKRAELEAQLRPLRAELAKMEEVAWTVDLYLGRDETLQQLRSGAPAPFDCPITVRQKVLVMAEEALLLLDNGGKGVDYTSIDTFVDWMLAAPENLDRLLPEPKGVVVMIPTRVRSDSGNMFEDAYRDAQNQASYWVLRNGANLWLLTVDDKLRVTERLLPKRDEFTDVFEPRLFGGYGERLRLEPGSDAWLKAEKVADARRRHYMRICMVLQGIADRTTVWQPQPPVLSFFDVGAQDAGKIRLIQDAEESIQLGTGQETFAVWQTRLNALLRPGQRVVGDWHRMAKGRLAPESADCPDNGEVHLLEERRRGGLVFRYQRTDQVWRRNVPIPHRPGYVYREALVDPARRASALIYPTDSFVLPFDLIEVRDIERFLVSREERSKHFLSMVPVLRAALAAKKVEAETEAPFRVLLHATLVNEGADLADADRLVDDLVHWWKVANTWSRPLNGHPQHEAKAIRQIVAEYRSRQNRPDETVEQRMVAAGRRVGGVIAVAKTRAGAWFAYSPSDPADPEPGVWLDITPIRRDGTLGEPKRWQKPLQHVMSQLQVAWQDDTWATWRFSVSPLHYLTGPEREAVTGQVVAAAAAQHPGSTPICVTETHDTAKPDVRGMTVFAWRDGDPATSEPVASERPFGWGRKLFVTWRVYVTKTRDGVTFEAARWQDPEQFAAYNSTDSDLWGGRPWRTNGSPWKVWADDALLARMADYKTRCAAFYRAEQDRRIARDQIINQHVELLTAAMVEVRNKPIHDRFIVDYGPGAEDLWPTHLATLKLPDSPVHPRELWGLMAIAHEHGQPYVGRTLAELAELAATHKYLAPGEWHTGARDIARWIGTYGHIVVPALPDEAPDA